MLKPVPNLLSCDEDGKVYWDGVECEYSADGLRAYTPFGAIKVALLVCSAFHGVKPKDKDLVAHWDDVPTNNKPSNLRWATTRENSMDAVRNGILKGYGKKQIVKRPNMGQGRRILSDEQIEKIQDAYWIDGTVKRLLDVRTIIELLSDSYTDEGIDIWLRARNRNLNMRRPIDLIVEGQIDTVIDEAKWVAGGM